VGQKVHPTGFRVGVIKDWESRWFPTGAPYTQLLGEDLDIRAMIKKRLANASVSKAEIERSLNEVKLTIHTAKPGIVIGKQGAAVEELRRSLEGLTGKKARVNIMEIRQPELDAKLVARNVAEQLERRVAFRRAMKQAVQRTMRMGARGIKIRVGGRLGGSEMARTDKDGDGKVPLQTLRADIDYGQSEAHTTYGRIGVKVWIYRGDVQPGSRVVEPSYSDQRGPRGGPRRYGSGGPGGPRPPRSSGPPGGGGFGGPGARAGGGPANAGPTGATGGAGPAGSARGDQGSGGAPRPGGGAAPAAAPPAPAAPPAGAGDAGRS
jgi:small subunit ribosomal protein S3